MLEKTVAWWKNLKWYFKYPAAIFVGVIVVLLVLGRVFAKSSQGLTAKQSGALDDLHQKQVNTTLKEQEAAVVASESDTASFDDAIAASKDTLKKIENKARADDADVVNNAGMTVEELNEWRKRQGR